MPTLTLSQWYRWGLSNLSALQDYATLVREWQDAETVEEKSEVLVKLIRLTATLYASLLVVPREAVSHEILETMLLDAMAAEPGQRGLFDRVKFGQLLRQGWQIFKVLGPVLAPETAPFIDLLGKLEAIGS